MKSFPTRVASAVGGTAVYLALAILGWGGIAAFFCRPAFIALTIVLAVLALAGVFAGGNLSRGVREDRGNRWVLIFFFGIGIALGYVPALTDRLDFWTIDGNATPWIGVALFALGGALRLWPVYVLGDRFSGLVAIQPGHTLVTTGIYSRIRNPSYFGLLMNSLGWSLAFRSGVGVLMTAALMPPLIARMRAEERLLASEFGAEYEAYRARTARLIPGIY
ncbi:MAG TPA: isoprenylcysteine carboxylmethyltransferase family protein [Stellaceae bacterium]|nr:isoprenylcysteine carboxylmethyltransferase family protein [Stellaceae bacterium]